VVRHRPDSHARENIFSRVDFDYTDPQMVARLKEAAREASPRVYRAVPECFDELERTLLALPEQVVRLSPEQLPPELRLDGGTITALKQIHAQDKEPYQRWVRAYTAQLREARDKGKLIVLPREEWLSETRSPSRSSIKLLPAAPAGEALVVDKREAFQAATPAAGGETQRASLLQRVAPLAEAALLPSPLGARLAGYTVDSLSPTHQLDRDLSNAAQAEAEKHVPLAAAIRPIRRNESILVREGERVSAVQWPLLAAEQRAYIDQLPWRDRLLAHLGMAGVLLLATVALAAYVTVFQPRVVQNHMRGIALAALLLLMLLIPMVAATGTWPLLLFATAPTLLAAMILAIAYDQRFAIGVATIHAIMVTVALDQPVGFFAVLWLGVLTCCFLLDDVRSRSKLVEVGGITALVMMLASAAAGAASLEPLGVIGRNCLFAGASGLGVGFIVLGILDFIEKRFRITTSMTLLEYADASNPLLRRLAVEAPGTYSHSLQVATLAEAAAEAIGANSLLCRVGSYYHDVGKINKPDYFCENQMGGANRHLNLNPNVSLLIIIGHVKDGVELAKEYGLPPAILPIIQQHHGTTLVEYFYHQACRQAGSTGDEGQEVSDTQYRYPGPRPRSRECAIVMIADCVESATRAMVDPTPSRIEGLIHDLILRRLEDQQFDEADLTFAELASIEKTMVKTLLSIYHGRLAYPSTAAATQAPAPESPPAAATKTA
jgi:putative nucleotidyltransferase with HDIG domain